MGFWIFMFISTLMIPFALLLIWYLCPRVKKINALSGYRTSRSMKNQSTWCFAQKECSKISWKMFVATLLLAVVVMPFFIDESVDVIGWVGLAVVMIQMIAFVVIIYWTEKALKKNFDPDGRILK
ncbi:MAG: SdpI family protein [Peptostreptococcaceae bacterium]|nr:SdpI family protein [Peptostreptococcaceae bacterium]